MKFGKSYAATTASFPAQWRETAIEYRKLKKVINRVAAELADLGLTSEVLKDLLEHSDSRVAPGVDSSTASVGRVSELKEDGTTGDVGEGETKVGKGEEISEKAKGKRRAVRGRPRASYELAGTSDSPQPRIRIVFSSASSASSSDDESSSSNHFTLLPTHSFDGSSDQGSSSNTPDRIVELDSSEEDTLASGGRPMERTESMDSNSASNTSSHELEENDVVFVDAKPKEVKLLKRMYGLSVNNSQPRSDEDGPDEEEDWMGLDLEGSSSHMARRKSDETIRRADYTQYLSEEPVQLATDSMDDGGEADDEAADQGTSRPSEDNKTKRPRHHRHRQHRREVFIPLNSDSEFLTLLAHALTSLAALQVAQKTQFAQAVEILAREVSAVSSPSRPKTDLYIWREIFSLWVEAQIFESDRERDRGERSVQDAEAKLGWYVDQVAKRGLAKKMRHKESRAALENFIKLNVELLDMKRFQMANEEAARKILKKHDKRTALNASVGFPQFIAAASNLSSDEDAGQQAISRVLHLPGATSLPHILLATFTNTLLPIIPSLDDYVCSICGDVAFKPIKLDCGHKFCVRCLVKMQKRGQDACPQCRRKVVLRANAANLDDVLQEFLKKWFPREVKDKIKANSIEASKEEMLEMGIAEHKCIIA